VGVALAVATVVDDGLSIDGAGTSEELEVDVALLGPVEVARGLVEVKFDALDVVGAA